jgi:hypothetical protein
MGNDFRKSGKPETSTDFMKACFLVWMRKKRFSVKTISFNPPSL